MLAFAFASVTNRPCCDIASLGEFASGVPFNPFMTFHMSLLLVLVMAPSRTSFQLSVFASLMASLASLHAFIHSCLLVLMVRLSWFLIRILARNFGKAAFLSSYKSITLIFCLVRTAYLSSYENIILIFSLVRTTFLSSYKKNILMFGLIRTAFLDFFVLVYVTLDNSKSSK